MPREGLKIWGGRGASINIIYYTTGFANIIYKNLVFGGRPGAGGGGLLPLFPTVPTVLNWQRIFLHESFYLRNLSTQ